jgi:hypothetical protein
MATTNQTETNSMRIAPSAIYVVLQDLSATQYGVDKARLLRGISRRNIMQDALGNTRCAIDGTSRGPCGELAYYRSSFSLDGTNRTLCLCCAHAAQMAYRAGV